MTTSTTTTAAEFAAVVARLESDASTLAAMAAEGVWPQVPLAATADLVVSLVRAGDALTAAASGGIAVVHSSGALPAGHVSTKRWLEVATGMSPHTAGARVARSLSLRDGFARTRLAWLAGQISDDMVRVITTGVPLALRRLAVSEQPALVEEIESKLVPFAAQATIAQVQAKLRRLRVAVDSDGVDARALAAYDEQQLTLVPVGDGYEVRGWLTAESAAVLLTVLDRTVEGWYRDGSLTPEDQATCGDDARAERSRRGRRPHLNAVALTEVLGRLLDAGQLGTAHQQRPHVLVTVDAADYRAGLGGHLHLPGLEPEPITAAAVDEHLCDADVTTILVRPGAVPDTSAAPGIAGALAAVDGSDPYAWLGDAAREVLYVGRTRRTAPPRLRRALTIRDQHCQFPGCRVTADRCDAHHVREWQDGGLTDLSNMLLLCHAHHRVVHRAGWTLTRRPQCRDGQPGAWQFDPPPRPPRP